MKRKLLDFINDLPKSFIDLLGYPTIKFYSDRVDLCFITNHVIRSLDSFGIDCDKFSVFSHDGQITYVYTFCFPKSCIE